MTAGNTKELMQEGMKLVQAGNNAQAYNLFRQVVSQEPENEFGWIWVSVTSNDRVEKRQALNQALRINPNSRHASEALRNLDNEERAAGATVAPPPFQSAAVAPPPFQNAPAPRVGQFEQDTQPDDLRAALTSNAKGKNNKKPNQNQPKVNKVKVKNSDPAATGRNRPGRSRRTLFFLLSAVFIALLILVGVFVILPRLNPQPASNDQVASGQPTPGTTAAPADTSSVVSGTAATGTTAATDTTAANATTPAATTAAPGTANVTTSTTGTTAATATTPAATTAAPGTTAVATPANPTAAVSGSNNQPLPPVTPVTSSTQVAPALQTARDKLIAGDFKAAIASYQSILQFDARNVQANLGLGNLYMTAPQSELPNGANRYAEAVRSFRVVTSQAPNWSGGFARLGEALAAQGDVKGAIEAYSKSLQLDPNGPERWVALASLYEKDGHPEQARFARERAGIATPIPPTTVPAAPTATPRR